MVIEKDEPFIAAKIKGWDLRYGGARVSMLFLK
jgi:hypothetical protein